MQCSTVLASTVPYRVQYRRIRPLYSHSNAPVIIRPHALRAQHVSASRTGTCGVTSAGNLHCWGKSFWELGGNKLSPELVKLGSNCGGGADPVDTCYGECLGLCWARTCNTLVWMLAPSTFRGLLSSFPVPAFIYVPMLTPP